MTPDQIRRVNEAIFAYLEWDLGGERQTSHALDGDMALLETRNHRNKTPTVNATETRMVRPKQPGTPPQAADEVRRPMMELREIAPTTFNVIVAHYSYPTVQTAQRRLRAIGVQFKDTVYFERLKEGRAWILNNLI